MLRTAYKKGTHCVFNAVDVQGELGAAGSGCGAFGAVGVDVGEYDEAMRLVSGRVDRLAVHTQPAEFVGHHDHVIGRAVGEQTTSTSSVVGVRPLVVEHVRLLGPRGRRRDAAAEVGKEPESPVDVHAVRTVVHHEHERLGQIHVARTDEHHVGQSDRERRRTCSAMRVVSGDSQVDEWRVVDELALRLLVRRTNDGAFGYHQAEAAVERELATG